MAFAVPASASPEAKPSSQLPSWVDGYTVNGELSWSNLSWVEPRYDKTAAGHARWDKLMEWVKAIKRDRTAAIRGQFKVEGIDASVLNEGCYGDDGCAVVESVDQLIERHPDEFSSFQALLVASREAKPAIEGFRLAVETAWHVTETQGPAERLHAAQVCDQAYMIALTGFHDPQRRLPALSAAGLDFFWLGLVAEMRKQQWQHVAFVKEQIVNKGWPSRAEIGEPGEKHLWLVVQHADEDPVFQYRMLQLMKPRVTSGDVRPQDQAYLHDRVMLKLIGKQRYGTQLMCTGGHLVPQPLEEDPAQLDDYRHGVGLPSFSEYLNGFRGERCGPT